MQSQFLGTCHLSTAVKMNASSHKAIAFGSKDFFPLHNWLKRHCLSEKMATLTSRQSNCGPRFASPFPQKKVRV